MKMLIPNQTGHGESRVAMVPAVVKRLAASGIETLVESGAGVMAAHLDQAYTAAGARVVGAEGWGEADAVVVVQPPSATDISKMKRGASLIGMLAPHRNVELIAAAVNQGVSAMALEYLPRITRAQAMDALSSQANLAGYKAVILAAERSPKIFPMLMTAAGTIQPAKVFVIGAGVAGLAGDRHGPAAGRGRQRVRRAAGGEGTGAERRGEVRRTAAGHHRARRTRAAMRRNFPPSSRRKQRELMAKVIAESDVVITTAPSRASRRRS